MLVCDVTYLYKLSIEGSSKFYIGITNNIEKRRKSHTRKSKKGGTKLYCAIRKYKNFKMTILAIYDSREDACSAEKVAIEFFKDKLYNMTTGGDGGWCINDKENWIKKLVKTRQGKTPAKGMKHTSENKLLFSKISREYWDNQSTYNAEDILKHSHREAKRLFGISTTHYYRLKKQYA